MFDDVEMYMIAIGVVCGCDKCADEREKAIALYMADFDNSAVKCKKGI